MQEQMQVVPRRAHRLRARARHVRTLRRALVRAADIDTQAKRTMQNRHTFDLWELGADVAKELYSENLPRWSGQHRRKNEYRRLFNLGMRIHDARYAAHRRRRPLADAHRQWL